MKKNRLNIEELTIRYLDGSIEPWEENELFSLIKKDKENEAKYREYTDIWVLSQVKTQKFDTIKAFHNFSKRIQSKKTEKKRITPHQLSFILLGVASVILILFIFYPQFYHTKEPAFSNFTTPPGTKGNITLSDQSVVWLNENSQLEYPEKFSETLREVKVTGEAYFEVTKDQSRPFIVDLGIEKIKVLGTSFNVKNKLNEKTTEITLLSGSISVEFENDNKQIIIKPNEKITYNKSSKSIKIEPVDAQIYNVWARDKLVFDNEKLSYVIACMEKWYDIKIEYTKEVNKIENISFSIRNEPVEEVMEGLQCIVPIKYKILNDNKKTVRK